MCGGGGKEEGGFIPSRGRTERRLPLCLHCCVRTFFGIDLTDVSSGIKKAADRDAGIILSDTQYAKRVPASAPSTQAVNIRRYISKNIFTFAAAPL